jgi:copper chaperone
MAATTFIVSGMTCGHCVAAVAEEVSKIDGVDGVDIDLLSGAVTVQSSVAIASSAFVAAVDEAGYSVVS